MSDTNKSFDDYFSNNFEDGLSSPSKYILRFTYEAGQQSRQAEIDELKNQLALVLDAYYKTDYFEEDVCVTAENVLNDKNRLKGSWYLKYVKVVQE